MKRSSFCCFEKGLECLILIKLWQLEITFYRENRVTHAECSGISSLDHSARRSCWKRKIVLTFGPKNPRALIQYGTVPGPTKNYAITVVMMIIFSFLFYIESHFMCLFDSRCSIKRMRITQWQYSSSLLKITKYWHMAGRWSCS